MAQKSPMIINDVEYFWFAVRQSWPINGNRNLKILSRRMETEKEALQWAEFCESQVKSKNKKHKYHAILMPWN